MSEGRNFAITTLDNPYDPLTQWDDWFRFDESNGYHSCSLLDRIMSNSYASGEVESEDAKIEGTIDEIVRHNPLIYKKVEKV